MLFVRFLAIAVLLIPPLIASRVNADEGIDAILMRVDQARADYDTDCMKLRAELIQFLEKEIANAQRLGNLERVTNLGAERESFIQKGTIPSGISTAHYLNGLTRTRNKLISMLEKTRKELTQAGDLEHARAIDTEITTLKKSDLGSPSQRGRDVDRVLWMKSNRTQYFLKGIGADWFEKAENGKRAEIFTERARTSDYIELRHNTMPITIRLGATSISVRLKDSEPFVEAKDSGAWIKP